MTVPWPIHQPAAPAAPPVAQHAEPRPRRRSATLPGKLGETIAAIFALGIATSLWYLGTLFTLLALETLGIPVGRLGNPPLGIPASAPR